MNFRIVLSMSVNVLEFVENFIEAVDSMPSKEQPLG
jgi:hypothetical protein